MKMMVLMAFTTLALARFFISNDSKTMTMYKQIKIFGHPVHPMLVAFPIAFYTGTLVSFIIYTLTLDTFWFRVGYVSNVAGVITAGLAVLPGFYDLVMLPDDSRAKTTGFKHMAFNLGAFFLFFVNIFLQMNKWNDATLPDATFAMVLSALGVVFTLCAGFLGWKMVQKHHVGIDLTPEQKAYEPVDEKLKRVA